MRLFSFHYQCISTFQLWLESVRSKPSIIQQVHDMITARSFVQFCPVFVCNLCTGSYLSETDNLDKHGFHHDEHSYLSVSHHQQHLYVSH